jgi:hypothetical protein
MRDHAQRHCCVSFGDEARCSFARDEAVRQRARRLPGIGPVTFHKWIPAMAPTIDRLRTNFKNTFPN